MPPMTPEAAASASLPRLTAYAVTLAFIGAVLACAFLPAWIITVPSAAALCVGIAIPGKRRRFLAVAAGLACGGEVSLWPLGTLLPLPPASGLVALRGDVQVRIGTMYPEPHGSLLMGLLTGDRSGLPYDIVQDFRTTGLSHILAVSGFNITLIVSMLMACLFWIPVRWRLLPAAIGVIVFVLFVGPSASVVRAAVMGMIGLLAIAAERQTHARLSILWACCAMLAWQPGWLTDDAGFQLSFLAVIGLTELSDTIKPWLKRVPETLGLRDALLATLAAQATATPWSTVLFGGVPLLSPLANVLAAPLIAPAMLLGGVSVLAGYVYEPLGLLLSAVTWLLLQAILVPSTLLAAVPGASWNPGSLTPWLAGAWYLWLLWWFVRRERRLAKEGGGAAARNLTIAVPTSPLPLRASGKGDRGLGARKTEGARDDRPAGSTNDKDRSSTAR